MLRSSKFYAKLFVSSSCALVIAVYLMYSFVTLIVVLLVVKR